MVAKTNIVLGCVNVRGIRQREKRRDVLDFLRRYEFALTCLVDTHITEELSDVIRSEWGNDVLCSYGTNNSRGISVLLNPNIGMKIVNCLSDNDGNFLVLGVEIDGIQALNIVVVYGPNEDNPVFYTKLMKNIESLPKRPLVLVGDWNFVLDPGKDSKHYSRIGNPRARQIVLDFMENENLNDIWRRQHETSTRFTWRRTNPSKFARLDFFLISPELLPLVDCSKIETAYRTDHNLITMSLQQNCPMARGLFWKFNNSLLNDEQFIDMIRKEIKSFRKLYALPVFHPNALEDDPDVVFSVNDQLFLETLLCHLRGVIIKFCATKKRNAHQREQNLITEISRLEKLVHTGNADTQTQLNASNEELQLLRKARMEGVMLRSKARWIEYGEYPSRYFCGLEKRQYTQKYISCLEINGTLINEQSAILSAIENHFSTLYKSVPRTKCLSDIRHLLNDFPRLNINDRESMEGKISLEEAAKSVKKLHNDKSPGPDGFSSNFFKCFWAELGPLLVRSFNYAFEVGDLSISQKQGTITLIPKPGKPKECIDSWRPISLLNTSQKILSAILAKRIKTVLSQLINPCQKGFMANRYIGECVRSIYDILWEVKKSKNARKVLILFADYRRAFDSLSHSFIMETLNLFNFGKDMQRWVTVMLKGASSCITQNKASTDFFAIDRGCRQGDCCSPLLFILCAEVLGIMVRANVSIRGFVMNNQEYKLEQYADDSTFILDGTPESFAACMSSLKEYSAVSGLELNVSKSQILFRGANAPPNFVLHSNFACIENRFKYLGIIFTNNMIDMPYLNFKSKVDVVENLLKGWLRRRLTLYGKRTVIKSLALSMLTHTLTVLPSPPLKMLNYLQKVFFKFIWNGGPDKIRRSHLITHYNIPCVEMYDKAMKLAWVKRLVSSERSSIFNVRSEVLLCCGDRFTHRFGDKLNPFWKDVCTSYDLFKSYHTCMADEIIQQPLHLSSKVLIGRKGFWNKHIFDAGCRTLGDLYNAEGWLMTVQQFRQEYRVQINALTFIAVRTIVKRLIGSDKINKIETSNIAPDLASVLRMKCRQYYNIFVNEKYKNINSLLPAQVKWNSELGVEVPWDDLRFWYSTCTKNTALLWLQDKIIHRILTTNYLVSKFMDVDELCVFCKREKETIVHLFVICNPVAALWIFAKNIIRQRLSLNVEFNKRNIILGLDPERYGNNKPAYEAVQRLILLIKQYVYLSKVKSVPVNPEHMLAYVKTITQAEFMQRGGEQNQSTDQKRIAHISLCCDAPRTA